MNIVVAQDQSKMVFFERKWRVAWDARGDFVRFVFILDLGTC